MEKRGVRKREAAGSCGSWSVALRVQTVQSAEAVRSTWPRFASTDCLATFKTKHFAKSAKSSRERRSLSFKVA